MQIIKNQPVVKKLSGTLSAAEQSNIAMVVESPTVLTDWYLINANRSQTVPGWKNIDRYIGEDSQVVFDKIKAVPAGGVDVNINTEFDDEVGYTENFQSSMILYPNTVDPIPGSCFTMRGSDRCSIFIVTGINRITMRSNPFVEVSYTLLSRDPKKLEQLEAQVYKNYTCCLSSVGTNKSLILADDVQDQLDEHVRSYLDLVFLYKDLYYSKQAAAFVFDGLPDKDGRRASFIDLTLWRFMFDERVVIFDDIVEYANSNNLKTIEPIFTACPDIMVEDNTYRRSIIYRIYEKDERKLKKFDEYRYPYIWNPPERITKWQGHDIWYLEGYQPHPGELFNDFYIWDEEFLCRIRNNDPYPLPGSSDGSPGCDLDACQKCTHPCAGEPVQCFNPYLRNVIINWINGTEIDFLNGVVVLDTYTIENYYLIPIVMGIYKQYIHGLQESGTTL